MLGHGLQIRVHWFDSGRRLQQNQPLTDLNEILRHALDTGFGDVQAALVDENTSLRTLRINQTERPPCRGTARTSTSLDGSPWL